MDLVVPANHQVKIKEKEKSDNYFDLARELKKLWNMKVKVILIVIGGLGTIPDSWKSGLESEDERKQPKLQHC